MRGTVDLYAGSGSQAGHDDGVAGEGMRCMHSVVAAGLLCIEPCIAYHRADVQMRCYRACVEVRRLVLLEIAVPLAVAVECQ
jgi:hypothetical protein